MTPRQDTKCPKSREKSRLLEEEKQLQKTIATDNVSAWSETMEEVLGFASNVSVIFENGDIETKRMVLRILGSDLKTARQIALIKPFQKFITVWSIYTAPLAHILSTITE